MLLLVGTVPVQPGEVFEGPVSFEKGVFKVGQHELPPCQGSAAMALAAYSVTNAMNAPAPYVLFGGDTGGGEGTRAVFKRFESVLASMVERHVAHTAAGGTEPLVITFHYMLPIMSLMKHAIEIIDRLAPPALLVADAGGMYAARAAGLSGRFELLTPDVGEIGFLAEKEATHPAYVAEYLFGSENFDVPTLIDKAYELGTASEVLIVKGSKDYVAAKSAAPHYIVSTIDYPDVPELEAIGGTGDTITGLASGYLSIGQETQDAAFGALAMNRRAGQKIGAQVFTPVLEIIEAFGATMHV